MGQIVDVTSTPWIDSGDAPPLALDRDKRDIISQGVADPLVDYDIIPLTYTNSRWSAFFYRVDEKDLKHVLPKCLDVEDDVVEFWYVDHLHTGLGPYGEMGLTVAVSTRPATARRTTAGTTRTCTSPRTRLCSPVASPSASRRRSRTSSPRSTVARRTTAFVFGSAAENDAPPPAGVNYPPLSPRWPS